MLLQVPQVLEERRWLRERHGGLDWTRFLQRFTQDVFYVCSRASLPRAVDLVVVLPGVLQYIHYSRHPPVRWLFTIDMPGIFTRWLFTIDMNGIPRLLRN